MQRRKTVRRGRCEPHQRRPQGRLRLVIAGLAVALGSTAIAAPGWANPEPSLEPFVAEASARFALPPEWIWAVMHAESNGEIRAVSPAGAMGLMQIMPRTWAELRARYGLGPDPFDPRDNILAGAAYLRELQVRYGAPGLLAAYNAGPARYEAYLAGDGALPVETRAYLAALAPALNAPRQAQASADPHVWRGAPVFVASEPAPTPASATSAADAPAIPHLSSPLFVALSRRRGAP